MILEVSTREACALVVFTAALLTAWNANSNGFVWDDRSAVLGNDDAQSSSLIDVFSHDFWGTHIQSKHSHKSYRPLTVLSFRLNYLMAMGHSAWLYHFTNALVHAGCSVLVWKVADLLFQQHQLGGLVGALTAGVLFAVHPIHCDAVASIVGRADLLCTSLSLLAFLAYVRGAKKNETSWRRLVVTVITGVFAALVRVWINGERRQMEWNILANSVVVQETRLTRMLSYAHLHAWYLWKLVWPRWLCFDYGYNTIPVIESITDPRNVYTLFAYAVVAGGLRSAILQLLGSNKYTARSTPIDTYNHPVQSASSFNKPKNVFGVARVVVLTCGTLILAAGCYRSHLRNADWVSEQMLFKAAVDVVPTNVKVLSNEAKNLLNPDPKKALDYLRIAIGMIPKHIESQMNAGLAFVTLAARNGLDEDLYLHGIRHLHKSVILAPNHFQAVGFIGGEIYTHWMKKRNDDVTIGEFLGSESIAQATKFLDHAIDRNSVYPTHFYNRGSIAYESGDFDTAIRFFRMTEAANGVIRDRKVDPELLVEASSIYNMLGVSYKRKGETDKALDMLRKGIELYPEETDLHINAALILHDLGNTDEAAAQIKAGWALPQSGSTFQGSAAPQKYWRTRK
ncbi:Tetratricopeptide repeat [Phytophthora cactorum]|nr:Tetratricopeptide repeat [Phytophthora cactorum]